LVGIRLGAIEGFEGIIVGATDGPRESALGPLLLVDIGISLGEADGGAVRLTFVG
jgi:hypothetical protein